MFLIDAIYINYGGALNLLRYLIETLRKGDQDFFLLADARCGNEFNSLPNVEYMNAKLSLRRSFYKKHKDDFSLVFCFANVPPPIQLNIPVITYFHNINLLTLSDCRDREQKIKFWLKRTYIKIHRRKTDEWFVQTSNTANELVRHLKVSTDSVTIFPFYKLPEFPKINKVKTDYVFVGEYSGSKGHDELLAAWSILHQKGYEMILHLTVSLGDDFLRRLNEAISSGVQIINHGFIPLNELAGIYMQCKATVYPSYNESFGLGLIEAMEAGCDVIASDLPFVYAVCKPSEVFDPSSPLSIVEAVLRYEKGQSSHTKLLVRDRVLEMISRISDNIVKPK